MNTENGRYAIQETPSVVDAKEPQRFQGIRREVTVPESSSVLESVWGSISFFLYSDTNILPGRTMDMYWLAVIRLTSIAVTTVVQTRLPTVLVRTYSFSKTTSSTPSFSKSGPYTITMIVRLEV